MRPSNADPSPPQKSDDGLPLDYESARPPNKRHKFGVMAGDISFFAMLIQIPWAMPLVVIFLYWMMDKESWDQAIWPKVLMVFPTLVAFVFGSYSVCAIGINRRNIKGILGLIFAAAFTVWILVTK